MFMMSMNMITTTTMTTTTESGTDGSVVVFGLKEIDFIFVDPVNQPIFLRNSA